MSGEDEFAARAAAIARAELEERLIQASRSYEDSMRSGDEYSAASAPNEYSEAKNKYDALTGGNQPQQQGVQLSQAQRNFLSRRQAGGDQLDPTTAPTRTSANIFSAPVSRQAPAAYGGGGTTKLSPSQVEAARTAGISTTEYAKQSQRMNEMKARGELQQER